MLRSAYALDVEILAPAEIAARLPVVDRPHAEIVGPTFSPHDGPRKPSAVRGFHRGEAAA